MCRCAHVGQGHFVDFDLVVPLPPRFCLGSCKYCRSGTAGGSLKSESTKCRKFERKLRLVIMWVRIVSRSRRSCLMLRVLIVSLMLIVNLLPVSYKRASSGSFLGDGVPKLPLPPLLLRLMLLILLWWRFRTADGVGVYSTAELGFVEGFCKLGRLVGNLAIGMDY